MRIAGMWRLISWGLFSVVCLIADDSREQFFETHVRPLLVERCYSCHTEVRTSGLRVAPASAPPGSLLASQDANGGRCLPGSFSEDVNDRADR